MERKVLRFLERQTDGRCPKNSEIAEHLRSSGESHVSDLLRALEDKGFIARGGSRKQRTIRLNISGRVLEGNSEARTGQTLRADPPMPTVLRGRAAPCTYCGCRVDACTCRDGSVRRDMASWGLTW
ncbi:hypothetical protein AB433_07485 [Croceicoccus naphthovorans]|uniref:LexA repressor DNA-binding domain-containing protein n=1 Tax=Croceicoccus naphthovorans TaxID=1348774 RepID=A0A0G3XF77_9SPHN|nr:hypothetical protein AB433_07485 [Croceicoccus naphthovorans]